MPDDAPNTWQARADATTFYGFTDLPSLSARGPVILDRGESAHVYDVHGGRYLDANSGLWNMVAGFDHPGLVATAQAQYARFPGYHAFFGRIPELWSRSNGQGIAVSPPHHLAFRRSRQAEENPELYQFCPKCIYFFAR